MTKFIATVKGRQHEWGILVPENAVDDMRADGFDVVEVIYVIPDWAVDLGLSGVWCFAQRVWNAPTRILGKVSRAKEGRE